MLGIGNRNWKRFVVAAALAALVGLMVVGCDSIGSSRAVPTFIPPTVAIPVVSPSNGVASQTPGVARGPSLVRVTRGSLAQTVNGRGRVGSVREATLYFPLQGVVNKILVATGDQVSQGTLLAQLDTFQLEQNVTAARFALDKSKLDLKQAQARSAAADFTIDVATNVYSRTLQIRSQANADYQAIAGAGMTDATVKARFDRFQQTDKDFLQASIDLNNAKIEKQSAALAIDVANLVIQQDQKTLEQTQTRLNGAKLSAPFAGLVVAIDKNVGDEVQAFEPFGAIADPTQLQVVASVAESDASGVGLGQAAIIVLDGFPDQEFTGTVKEISAKPAIFQGKGVYQIVLAFDHTAQVPPSLRVGADVSIVQRVKDNVLIVPTSAIATDGSKNYLAVVRDGKPQRVQVQVGIASDTQSEILSGVSEGEQLQVP